MTYPPPAGRAKGGHARAAAMSPEQRREQATRAAQARWSGTARPKIRKARPVKYSEPHRYHPDTLPAVVAYLKERITATETRLKFSEADRRSAPDPDPVTTRNLKVEHETLRTVLLAVRDAELKHTKRTLDSELGI